MAILSRTKVSIFALGCLCASAIACGSSPGASAARGTGGGAATSGGGDPSGGSGGSKTTGAGGKHASDGGGGTGGAPPVPMEEIHFIGRFDRSDPKGPRFEWSGSSIVTRFSGTSLNVQLSDQGNWFAVVVDGGEPTVLHANGGQTDYPVVQDLVDGEHDVWIERRTEAFDGVSQFLGFTTSAGGHLIATPEPFSRRIELVGDSITCGAGDIGKGPDCPFADDTEDEYVAWGALAARALGAEHHGISYSGIGVYRNGHGSTDDQMPVRYERTIATDAASQWDFSWEPDVVVVDLGTNDFATGDPGQHYIDAYTAFAKQIRDHHPNALILCAIGSMLDGYDLAQVKTYTSQIIANRTKDGDTNIDRVDLGVQQSADGYGCASHPSAITHQKMADRLVTKIRASKGW